MTVSLQKNGNRLVRTMIFSGVDYFLSGLFSITGCNTKTTKHTACAKDEVAQAEGGLWNI